MNNQNDALKLPEWLTGIADAIREVKGTSEKINAQNYRTEILNLKSSGSQLVVDNGMIYQGKNRVRYFDIDGTVLKIEYVENGGKLTPPENPSYDQDYLIFDEWNYDIDNYIVERPTDVGAIYSTVNDLTYMFCKITKITGLSPTLKISGHTLIDWGDGTTSSETSHSYVAEGNYVIKIYGDFIANTAFDVYLFGTSNLRDCLQKVYIKKGITRVSGYTFRNCKSLEIVSLPSSITSLESNSIASTFIKFISLPKGVTNLPTGVFEYCYSLKNVVFSQYLKTFSGTGSFYECCSLEDFLLSNQITSNVTQKCFYNCRTLSFYIFSNSVAKIGKDSFYGCYIKNYFILCDSVPTLENTSAFTFLNKSATFWVNDSIIEELKVATNWSSYADYFKPLSEYIED